MAKSAIIQARIEPSLKSQADDILAGLGINATTAITLFYTQLVRQRGMPIELKVPNQETLAAMNELKDLQYRSKTQKFKSVADLMGDLNS